MASKFREWNMNIEVNLFYVIVMRPKLTQSANCERTQLQKFLGATGKSMRYLDKWRQFLAISLVKFWCVFNIGQLRICMFCRWRLSFGYDTIVYINLLWLWQQIKKPEIKNRKTFVYLLLRRRCAQLRVPSVSKPKRRPLVDDSLHRQRRFSARINKFKYVCHYPRAHKTIY